MEEMTNALDFIYTALARPVPPPPPPDEPEAA